MNEQRKPYGGTGGLYRPLVDDTWIEAERIRARRQRENEASFRWFMLYVWSVLGVTFLAMSVWVWLLYY